MDKQNESTRLWRHTYDATSTTSRTTGRNYCLWLSSLTTPRCKKASRPHRLTRYLVTHQTRIETRTMESKTSKQSSKQTT
ncbi:hypothetical protein FSOLCH5_15510 [Fusarium solani]